MECSHCSPNVSTIVVIVVVEFNWTSCVLLWHFGYFQAFAATTVKNRQHRKIIFPLVLPEMNVMKLMDLIILAEPNHATPPKLLCNGSASVVQL
jgi:hypothetical protein